MSGPWPLDIAAHPELIRGNPFKSSIPYTLDNLQTADANLESANPFNNPFDITNPLTNLLSNGRGSSGRASRLTNVCTCGKKRRLDQHL
jgi:hypothetical protein